MKVKNVMQNDVFSVRWSSQQRNISRVAHHFVSLKKETKSVSSRRLNVLRDDSQRAHRIKSKGGVNASPQTEKTSKTATYHAKIGSKHTNTLYKLFALNDNEGSSLKKLVEAWKT